MTQYTVWSGGTELNDYYLDTYSEAENIAVHWEALGYDDVQIEEIEVDPETPEQMNDWLRSGGY
jgi:hypothetical protein